MADVTTYKRCLQSYASPAGNYTTGEVRASSDAAVTANPAYWGALTDTDFSGGRNRVHA